MGSSGLGSVSSGSGIDVQAFVDQIIYADRAPVRLLQTQQTQFNAQATALRDLATKLSTLVALKAAVDYRVFLLYLAIGLLGATAFGFAYSVW